MIIHTDAKPGSHSGLNSLSSEPSYSTSLISGSQLPFAELPNTFGCTRTSFLIQYAQGQGFALLTHSLCHVRPNPAHARAATRKLASSSAMRAPIRVGFRRLVRPV